MDEHRQTLSRRWLIAYGIIIVALFFFKAYLAYSTAGAGDISVWTSFRDHIRECGICVYHTGGMMQYPGGQRIRNPFNHPPFMIHYIRIVDFIAMSSHFEFKFVFRLITSLFDVGSALILYRLLRREGLFTEWRFLLYLLAPATLIISGYHGNTDTVIIFFVLLSALLTSRPALSGSAFGMALCVKIVPVMFLFVFLAWLKSWRSRLLYLSAATLVGVVLSTPFLFQEPFKIAREVLGYGSISGRWGWSVFFLETDWSSSIALLIVKLSAYALLAALAFVSVQLNRRQQPPPLMVQLGLIAFLFMALTPAWGTNYMAWLDPFPVAIGVPPALVYYLTSGAFLACMYFILDTNRSSWMFVSFAGVLFVAFKFLMFLKRRE